MKLQAGDEGTLILGIADAIEATTVTNYDYVKLPRKWFLEIRDKLSDDFNKKFGKISDNSGLYGFVKNAIALRLFTEEYTTPSKKMGLSSYKEFSKPLEVSRSIIGELSSSPQQYQIITRCSLPIAREVNRTDINLRLSDQLCIVSGGMIKDSVVLSAKSQALASYLRVDRLRFSKPLEIQENGLYFTFRASGLITDQVDTRLVRDMSDEIRAFYGCCLAHGLLSEYEDLLEDSYFPIVIANRIPFIPLTHLARARECLDDGPLCEPGGRVGSTFRKLTQGFHHDVRGLLYGHVQRSAEASLDRR